MTRRIRTWLIILALAALPAAAQADIFMLVQGVPGDVTAKGHENWFNIEGVAWGIDRSNAAAPHTFNVSLELSANVSALAQASANGAGFNKIVIDRVFTSGGNVLLLASRLTCDEALIREFSSSGDPDDRAKVELGIRCAKLTWEGFDYDSRNNALAKSAKGSWNFKSNTP